MEYGTLKKQKSEAFHKTIYLLGRDADGVNYWLEHPSWDCGCYWGFGYIETYTNNRNPSKSKDISSHSHAIDFYSTWAGGEEESILKTTTFTSHEMWKLCKLFEQFYALKKSAEVFKDLKKHKLSKSVNNKVIPTVFREILDILTPKNSEGIAE